MKFAHMADTHLGKTNFKLEERREDFRRAFKQAIDICIEEDVDFVIHGGDLFDDPRPEHKEIIFAMQQLKRLRQHEIPFFIIPGSHDIGVEGTILSLLEEVGLATNLAAKRYVKKTENGISKTGEEIGNAYITGLEGRRARAKELYRSIDFKPKPEAFNIFVFHHTISSVESRFADIPTSSLPKGFDYYAGAHYHFGPKVVEEKGREVYYPGSTEYGDTREMLKGNTEKGIFIVEDGQAEFRKVDLRPVEVREKYCSGLSPKEVTEECIKLLGNPDSKRKPIFLTRLKGKLEKGSKTQIDRAKISREAKKRGYLYNRILLSRLENPEKERYQKVKEKNIGEIEKSFLKKKGYSQEEIGLAQSLVRHLPQGREDIALEVIKRHFGLIKEKSLKDFK